MDILPSVLFASCTSKKPREIIELLLGELPEGREVESGIVGYPWHIDTKYYQVDVNLCTIENKSLGSQPFAESVQAVVLFFDSENKNGLAEAKKWLPYVKEYEVEIQILLCRQCKETSAEGVTRLAAQEWCIKEDFELVELDPKLDEEWESEQDFIETTGIKRVKQALEAHVWPNLKLKERKEPTSMSALLHGGASKSTATGHDDIINSFFQDEFEGRNGDASSDDLSNLEFSELYSQLMSMKERASSLPDKERKEFAERIVCAYWKVMGGEQQELFDI